MITDILRMTRWELFKLRKRWAPWVLLAIAAVISQLFLWGFFIAHQSDVSNASAFASSVTYSVENEDGTRGYTEVSCVIILDAAGTESWVAGRPEKERERARSFAESSRELCVANVEDPSQLGDWSREKFVLPASLSNGLGFIQSIGAFLITILAVAAMGVEYGWGTLRTALTRGTGRWQFLGAKGLSLAMMGVAGLLFLSLALVASSLLAASLTLSEGRGLADFGEWSTAAVLLGKSIFSLLPYIVLGLFLSVLTSSSGAAIGIGLGYLIVEFILVATLGNLFDWFSTIYDYMLGPNVAAWMVQEAPRVTGADSNMFGLSDLPSQLHGFLVVTAYIVIISALTLRLFHHKDIAGAKGE